MPVAPVMTHVVVLDRPSGRSASWRTSALSSSRCGRVVDVLDAGVRRAGAWPRAARGSRRLFSRSSHSASTSRPKRSSKARLRLSALRCCSASAAAIASRRRRRELLDRRFVQHSVSSFSGSSRAADVLVRRRRVGSRGDLGQRACRSRPCFRIESTWRYERAPTATRARARGLEPLGAVALARGAGCPRHER